MDKQIDVETKYIKLLAITTSNGYQDLKLKNAKKNKGKP